MILNLLFFAMMQFWALFTADQPEFKGGQPKLEAFIANNMVYPEYAKQNCLQGTIEVSFKLDHTGKIFYSKVQKGYGIDLDKEALRIVRLSSGRWIVPASHDTTIALVLPVNFSLKDARCAQMPRSQINNALTAYRSREDLTKAIFNFYDKNPGKKGQISEKAILDLKEQLGYNDGFINKMIRQGQSKLKQGDKESACEDFTFVHKIGSDKADKLIAISCN